jgi:hypothetical protein
LMPARSYLNLSRIPTPSQALERSIRLEDQSNQGQYTL